MEFDIADMMKTSKEFEKKLNALAEISVCSKGNKLGVQNDETYISWWYLQGLHRTFYGEGIDQLLIFLDKIFADYFIFHIMLRRANEQINNEKLLTLRRENDLLIKKWKDGLNYLKNEYKQTEIVQEKIKKLNIYLL